MKYAKPLSAEDDDASLRAIVSLYLPHLVIGSSALFDE
jgi:hypothetical protein